MLNSPKLEAIRAHSAYLFLRKYLHTYPEWHFAPPRVQIRRATQALGTDYGGYVIDPSILPSDPVVYSVGVGQDISWDLEMIRQYGLTVYAFDPTPRVKEWLASQNPPKQFRFHDVGIADFDGDAAFHLPPRSDFISHSIIPARQYSPESIQVPMIRLKTAMERLGHTRIDVLKMDVEGAEYRVIDNLVRENIAVNQMLVEFHHRLSSIGIAETRRALRLLNDYGMMVCYVCPRAQIFSLVRVAKAE